jgi:hypothetical protein
LIASLTGGGVAMTVAANHGGTVAIASRGFTAGIALSGVVRGIPVLVEIGDAVAAQRRLSQSVRSRRNAYSATPAAAERHLEHPGTRIAEPEIVTALDGLQQAIGTYGQIRNRDIVTGSGRLQRVVETGKYAAERRSRAEILAAVVNDGC